MSVQPGATRFADTLEEVEAKLRGETVVSQQKEYMLSEEQIDVLCDAFIEALMGDVGESALFLAQLPKVALPVARRTLTDFEAALRKVEDASLIEDADEEGVQF